MSAEKGAEASQLPQWETPAAATANSTPTTSQRLVRLRTLITTSFSRPSPHSSGTFSNLRPRTVYIILCSTLVILSALVLGLAIGLPTGVPLSLLFSRGRLPLPGGAQVYNGDLTYYGPGLGACGITSGDDDRIVSVSHFLFDAQARGTNPNANPLCGRKIRAQRFDARAGAIRSIDLMVVDRCVGCQPTDLDVSPGAFSQIADPVLGRVHDMSWAWI